MDQRKIRLRPSIASADPLRIADAIDSLGSWPYLHIDIEDGSFVPNITFGMKIAGAIAAYAKQELDAHLLVHNPMDYVSALADMGVKSLCVHVEAMEYPLEALAAIHKAGMAAGLALNFKTMPESLEPFLSQVDYLLLMTAEPDGAGQLFSAAILPKLRRARTLLSDRQGLWVDGGIHARNIRSVIDAGATDIILGRAAFAASCDPEQALQDLEAVNPTLNHDET